MSTAQDASIIKFYVFHVNTQTCDVKDVVYRRDSEHVAQIDACCQAVILAQLIPMCHHNHRSVICNPHLQPQLYQFRVDHLYCGGTLVT
jgi:hypothetical protein